MFGIVCVGAADEGLPHSPIGLITLVLIEGNTYRYVGALKTGVPNAPDLCTRAKSPCRQGIA